MGVGLELERLTREENHWTLEVEETSYSDSDWLNAYHVSCTSVVCFLLNLYLLQLFENIFIYPYVLNNLIFIRSYNYQPALVFKLPISLLRVYYPLYFSELFLTNNPQIRMLSWKSWRIWCEIGTLFSRQPYLLKIILIRELHDESNILGRLFW